MPRSLAVSQALRLGWYLFLVTYVASVVGLTVLGLYSGAGWIGVLVFAAWTTLFALGVWQLGGPSRPDRL